MDAGSSFLNQAQVAGETRTPQLWEVVAVIASKDVRIEGDHFIVRREVLAHGFEHALHKAGISTRRMG